MRFPTRPAITLAATLTVLSPVPAKEQVRVDNARDLARACRGIDKSASTSANARRARPQAAVAVTDGMLICLGYMQAIQDFAVLTDENGRYLLGACAPPNTTLVDMVRSFVAYADTHRHELGGNAATVVVRSLRAAFPCPPEVGTVGTTRPDDPARIPAR